MRARSLESDFGFLIGVIHRLNGIGVYVAQNNVSVKLNYGYRPADS